MNLAVEGSFLAVPAAHWLTLLFNLVFKGTSIILLAWLLARLLATFPAAWRSRVWTTTFVLLLGLPLAMTVAPHDSRSLIRLIQGSSDAFASASASVAGDAGPAGQEAHGAADRELDRERARPAVQDHPGRTGWRIVAAIWLAGFLWNVGRTIRRVRSGRQVARAARRGDARAIDDLVREVRLLLDIRRPVALRFSDAVAVPFVSGLALPSLVLPSAIRGWDAEGLRSVVLHELAHVARGDLLRLIVAELACAVHWFNPLAWAASRRAGLDLEMACDDVVCGDRRDSRDYARQLVWFARRVGRDGAARMPGMARSAGLDERVRHILEAPEARQPRQRSPQGLARLGASVLAAALLFPALAVPLVGQERTSSGRSVGAPPTVTAPAVIRPEPPIALRPATTLHEAAAAGDLRRVTRALADDGTRIDAPDDEGMTPLARAAWNGHVELVAYLIRRGADPDVKNHNGLTPVFCAIDRGRRTMAELFIRSGADLTTRGYRGRTLLHMAARVGHVGVARSLIERGADVNAVDMNGATPLDLAAWHGNGAVFELLAGKGALRSNAEPPSLLRKPRQV